MSGKIISGGGGGAAGPAATIEVGDVTTVPFGDPATVTNSGDANAAVFDFEIPAGEDGAAGDAATIAVGTVSTVAPGDPATVTNSGSSSAAIFDFEIPQGEDGTPGDAATIAVGTVTTVANGDPATVTNTGTTSAAIFDFEIPEGGAGTPGAPGLVVDSQRDRRATDAAIINVADGWQDVLQVSLVLANATSVLEAHANLLGTVVVGAQARLVLDGGNYTDEVIALAAFPGGAANLDCTLLAYRDLDDIDTYTLTLQAQGVGVFASVTPLKDSTLIAHVLSS